MSLTDPDFDHATNERILKLNWIQLTTPTTHDMKEHSRIKSFYRMWKFGKMPNDQIMNRREKRAMLRRDYTAAAWYQFNQMQRLIWHITGEVRW